MFGSFRDLAFMGSALKAAPPVPGLDPDAAAYIAAVEAADGQALEAAVADAINNFVIGCKADGIWNAIKASCILAGARTLNGALVPLAGTAPTNFNFVSGDYNRKTGLVGDGSTKYLDSNRNNNADPQNNHHLSCYLGSTSPDTAIFIGARSSMNTFKAILPTGAGNINGRRMGSNSSLSDISASGNPVGFHGLSRATSSAYSRRVSGLSAQIDNSSVSPVSNPVYVFAITSTDTDFAPIFFTGTRLAFYSIGEALDLALLDSRVTALIAALGAAIP